MDEMAKHKNRRDLMEEIEDPFLDDPEAETADDEITDEAAAQDETAALRAGVADLKDRLLRALADVENIRKRAERSGAPALLHRDLDLTLRAARDIFAQDFSVLWVDDDEEYRRRRSVLDAD